MRYWTAFNLPEKRSDMGWQSHRILWHSAVNGKGGPKKLEHVTSTTLVVLVAPSDSEILALKNAWVVEYEHDQHAINNQGYSKSYRYGDAFERVVVAVSPDAIATDVVDSYRSTAINIEANDEAYTRHINGIYEPTDYAPYTTEKLPGNVVSSRILINGEFISNDICTTCSEMLKHSVGACQPMKQGCVNTFFASGAEMVLPPAENFVPVRDAVEAVPFESSSPLRLTVDMSREVYVGCRLSDHNSLSAISKRGAVTKRYKMHVCKHCVLVKTVAGKKTTRCGASSIKNDDGLYSCSGVVLPTTLLETRFVDRLSLVLSGTYIEPKGFKAYQKDRGVKMPIWRIDPSLRIYKLRDAGAGNTLADTAKLTIKQYRVGDSFNEFEVPAKAFLLHHFGQQFIDEWLAKAEAVDITDQFTNIVVAGLAGNWFQYPGREMYGSSRKELGFVSTEFTEAGKLQVVKRHYARRRCSVCSWNTFESTADVFRIYSNCRHLVATSNKPELRRLVANKDFEGVCTTLGLSKSASSV